MKTVILCRCAHTQSTHAGWSARKGVKGEGACRYVGCDCGRLCPSGVVIVQDGWRRLLIGAA